MGMSVESSTLLPSGSCHPTCVARTKDVMSIMTMNLFELEDIFKGNQFVGHGFILRVTSLLDMGLFQG